MESGQAKSRTLTTTKEMTREKWRRTHRQWESNGGRRQHVSVSAGATEICQPARGPRSESVSECIAALVTRQGQKDGRRGTVSKKMLLFCVQIAKAEKKGGEGGREEMVTLRWMAQQGQEGLGTGAGIRALIGCPKLAACHGSVCTASPLPAWADVTHWSGKLHQTYSCSPTL